MKTSSIAVLFVLSLALAHPGHAWELTKPNGDLLDKPNAHPGGGGSSSGGGGSSGYYTSGGWWIWSEGVYNFNCEQPDVSPPRMWFSERPYDDEKECPDEIPAAPTVRAQDACDGDLGTIDPVVNEEKNPAGALVRVKRTWTATDAAGKSSKWIQVIDVRDVAWPTIDVPRIFSVKVDEKTRKGKMPDFRRFAHDDRCKPTLSQSVSPGTEFPSGHKERVVLIATDECGRKTTNSPTVVFGCADCPGSCSPGEGQPKVGSVELELGLGRLANGRSAGSLRLYAQNIESWLGRPEGMVYVPENGGGETIYTPDGVLCQIRTAQALTELVPVSRNSYLVRFYSLTNCLDRNLLWPSTNWHWRYESHEDSWDHYETDDGEYIGLQDARWATNWCYATTGTPFMTWAITRPWSSSNSLKITKIQPGNVCHYEYVYDASRQVWSLDSGDGLRIEANSSVWDESNTVHTIDHAVMGVAGPAGQEIREYRRFPWGEAQVAIVRDSSGAALTDACGYYEDPQEPGKYMRTAWERSADGGFVWYDYDEQGRIVAEARTWKDVDLSAAWPAVDLDQAQATLYGYAPVDPADDGALEPRRPRSVVETIAGTTVSKTLYSFLADADGETIEVREECLSAEAAFGDSGNLRTTTVRHPETEELWPAQPKSIQYPDGRLDRYEYERGDYAENGGEPGAFTPGTGDFVRITLNHGTVEHTNGTGKTTREVTVQDVLRGDMLRETYVYDGTQLVRVDWTTQTYDELGHPLVARFADGTFRSNAWDGCCGKGAEIGADGSATYFEYDVLGRLKRRTAEGVAPADYLQQPDRTTLYQLDAEGRVLQETTVATNLALVSSNQYDLAGRLVKTIDAAGLETRYEYATADRLSTVIRPGGATETTENYLDGQPKSVVGTGVVPRYYDYGVNEDGSRWTLVRVGSPDSSQWEKTTTDMLGRVIKEEKPGFGGPAVTTASEYDEKGHLAATRTWTGDSNNAPLRPATLYEYDELGELFRTAIDVNGNGIIDLAGPDRVNETQTRIVKKYGEQWRETLSKVYPAAGGTNPVVVATQRQAMLGAGGGAAAKAQSVDVRGNLTRTFTEVHPTPKTVRTVRDVPESTANAVSVVVNGLLQSEMSPSGLTTFFTYDALGRQIGVTDPRTGTSTTHYDDQGRVDYIEDAAGNRTSFVYDPDTGLRTCVIDALTNATYTAYDVQGRPTNVWGATYPVAYEYDAYGRMSALKTWRDTNSEPDVTRWFYDEATGLLTNKVYADGNGTAYEYDAAGRLTRRIWARGVATDYAYDALGQLTNIDYSDDTPDVSFVYDRMGRQTAITDILGTHINVYDPATLELVAEQLADGGSLARGYDAFGRIARLKTGRDYVVNYGYDEYGRMANVSHSDALEATYSYLPGSDLLAGWSSTGGPAVGYAYESHRDLRTDVSNSFAGIPISSFAYVYDAVGRRIRRVDSAVATNFFGYNVRSELDVAVMGTNQFGYQYDAIGNRQVAVANDRTVEYEANALNQYASVLPSAGTPAYDVDGNMTSDGTHSYIWDAENRLVEIRPIATNAGAKRVQCLYDYQGRRVGKRVFAWGTFGGNDDWYWSDGRYYVYDGWNLIGEYEPPARPATLVPYASATNMFLLGVGGATNASYVWGLDLSGSLQGAGGVGGLICQIRDEDGSGRPLFSFCDANGNVTGLAETNGAVVARYDYDPYGNLMAMSGDQAEANPFRFSSKYCDDETGLYYCGYRFYSPQLGRWINRDPIEERGGLDLYAFVGNSPLDRVDPFGQWGREVHLNKTREWASSERTGFINDYAGIIATADEGVDANWLSGVAPAIGDLERHMKRTKGGKDSRNWWYDTEFTKALKFLNKTKCKEAAKAYGRGLHSLQDRSAHRDWHKGGDWPALAIHPFWWDFYGPIWSVAPTDAGVKWVGDKSFVNTYWQNNGTPDTDDYIFTGSYDQRLSQARAINAVYQESMSSLQAFRDEVKKSCCAKEMLLQMPPGP